MFIFMVHQFRTTPAAPTNNSTAVPAQTNTSPDDDLKSLASQNQSKDNDAQNNITFNTLTFNDNDSFYQVNNYQPTNSPYGNPAFPINEPTQITYEDQKRLLEGGFGLIALSGEYVRWKMLAAMASQGNLNALNTMMNEIKASDNVRNLIEKNALFIISLRENRPSDGDDYGYNFGFDDRKGGEKKRMTDKGYNWFIRYIRGFQTIDSNNNHVLDVFDLVDDMHHGSDGYANYLYNKPKDRL